jgi:predicted small secreted protein
MRKTITLIPGLAIAAIALTACGTSQANGAGGPQGEVPLGAESAPATTGPASDDRTWNVGDCITAENGTTGEGPDKVTCSSSTAYWRVGYVITDINAQANAICAKQMASDPQWQADDSVVMDADHYNFCLVRVRPVPNP